MIINNNMEAKDFFIENDIPTEYLTKNGNKVDFVELLRSAHQQGVDDGRILEKYGTDFIDGLVVSLHENTKIPCIIFSYSPKEK